MSLGALWASGPAWTNGDGVHTLSDYSRAFAADVGIGYFIHPAFAIVGQLAFRKSASDVVSGNDDDSIYSMSITTGSIVPTLQYWPTSRVWIGAGVGVAISHVNTEGFFATNSAGLAFDARAGWIADTFNGYAIELAFAYDPDDVEIGYWTGPVQTFTGVASMRL